MNVRIVGDPLARIHTSLNTGEFTLEKGLMSAVNVRSLLLLFLPLAIIREFTLDPLQLVFSVYKSCSSTSV